MSAACADDWRDVPPPVVSHPRDAATLGRWPWHTAPQPAPVVAPRLPPGRLTTYAASRALSVRTSSLWKRARDLGVDVSHGLPLDRWRVLAAGLARVDGAR